MIAIILAASLAAAADGPASTPTPPSPPPAAGQGAVTVTGHPTKLARDPNKVICRAEDASGSLISNRICMTRTQWDIHDEQMQKFFQDVQDKASVNTGTFNANSQGAGPH